MGNIGFIALKDLGLALRDKLNITTFIETGTYKGQTAHWAAGEFDRVVTIEGDKDRYDKTVKMYKNLKNVRFIHGDSRKKLRSVVSRLRKPALIWLDAHWCGNYDKSQINGDECPLKDELEILTSYKTNHAILIDDARLFTAPPPLPHDPTQWPTLEEIKALLPTDYHIAIWNDAIIAVPPEAATVVKRFTVPTDLKIVVLTSNAYVHCLPAFSYLFNHFWDAGQAVKVVRYDVRPPKLPGNFTNFAVGIQDDYSWSGGLLRYLAYHTDDLILLMLEDYFIDKPVDVATIKQWWYLMQARPDIAKIDLSGDRLKVAYRDFNSYMVQSEPESLFQTSLQAAIWRKDFLTKFLKDNESAWQFEKRGTKRVIQARKNGEFNDLVLGCKTPPLSYVNAKGGEGSHPELWDFKKFPDWMKVELRTKGMLSG